MSKIVFTVPPVDMEEIWGELSEEGSVLPPMGIAILASVTRGKGFDVKILDPIAEKLDIESTLKRIFDYNPKYVGITATTDMLSSAARLADRLKKIDPSYTILLGGPHISALPLDTMEKFASFDYGFVGESEDTLPEFLEAFEKKGDLSKVKGIVIRNSGKPVYTGPRQIIMDMDRIPMPAWDALPDIRSHYRPALINYKRQPVTSLVTSRGCAGMCIFCDASVFGRRVRAYSADYVMRSIDELMKGYGIKEVCFYDDTFVAFKKRLSEICNMMIERKLDLSWSCNARVNLVNPGILKLMKRAGCWQIAYGIESGSQKVLDILKKGINIRQIRDAVRWTKEAGISTKGFLMIGNPGETAEDIEMTRRLMLDIELDDVLVEYFTPYPGAEIYNKVKDYGTIVEREDRVSTFSSGFVPYGLSGEYLKKQFKSFYSQFYFRPRIILNYIVRLGNPAKIWALFLKFVSFVFRKQR